MSKLYWQLRRAMSRQSKYRGSIITSFRAHDHAPLKMRRYPRNRWGYGYWRRKHK